jgi:transcription initiation factor TFIIIB Brf1 subunit/transcription initiation factor TFIIB
MIGNIRDVKECPDCGSDNIYFNENLDQVICRDCGCIFEPFAEGADDDDVVPAPRASKAKKTVKKPAKRKK